MSTEQPISFTAFVMSFATTVAVHFGDLPDPSTGKKEVDLMAARQMIDILAMLQEKTRGNLSDDERQLLEDLLYDLRMRFLQAAQQDAQPRIVTP